MALLDEVANKEGLDEEGRVFLGRIMVVESDGDTYARPPLRADGTRGSRAAGIFQVVPGTWNDYAKQYNDIQSVTPENMGTANDPRYDVKQQILFGVRFTRDNERALTSAIGGHPPTAGQLYLAHFLGAGGAIKVLKASPDTKITNLISKEAIDANGPFVDTKGKRHKGVRLHYSDGKEVLFKDFTATDIQVWANRKMGQPDGKFQKRNGIMDWLPDALGDMKMSDIALIAVGILALLGVVFSGDSKSNNLPNTPRGKGGGRGLFG